MNTELRHFNPRGQANLDLLVAKVTAVGWTLVKHQRSRDGVTKRATFTRTDRPGQRLVVKPDYAEQATWMWYATGDTNWWSNAGDQRYDFNREPVAR